MQLRCVIVDDDVTFLDAARASLERDGLTVAGVASSSAEAVQIARELRPDVVLIDIRLGEESGLDLARWLARDEQSAALIMISTHSREDYADLIAESPALGFLPKVELSAAAIRHLLLSTGLPCTCSSSGMSDDGSLGRSRGLGPSGAGNRSATTARKEGDQ
jgi:DNA-binding NarL/FixJ family response regulator